jgi:hypothetical protein
MGFTMLSSWHFDKLGGQLDVVGSVLKLLDSKWATIVLEPSVLFEPVTLFASMADIYLDRALKVTNQNAVWPSLDFSFHVIMVPGYDTLLSAPW